MAEYVERRRVSDACYAVFEDVVSHPKKLTAEETRQTLLRFEKAINSVPAADVAPVVLCRDCEYWNTEEKSYFGTKCRCERFSLVGYSENYVLPSDFCSYGERREDG